MDLDIIIFNSRHFTSKKDNKVYNTIDFIIVNKESYIDSDKFKGYIPSTAFTKDNHLKDIKVLENVKGHFDEYRNGLRSNLKLTSITYKDGTTINLA